MLLQYKIFSNEGLNEENIFSSGALVMPRPSANHQWYYNKSGLPVVDVVIDPYLSTKLRPHQREGLLFLYECVMGMR